MSPRACAGLLLAACAGAVCMLALGGSPTAAADPNATFYQQGLAGKQWNTHLKATIPAGQCSGDLHIQHVCREAARPHAHSWLVVVLDGAVPLVRMFPSLRRAYIYRDDGAPRPGACDRPAAVRAWAHCAEKPYDENSV